jgi:hypothetical protein
MHAQFHASWILVDINGPIYVSGGRFLPCLAPWANCSCHPTTHEAFPALRRHTYTPAAWHLQALACLACSNVTLAPHSSLRHSPAARAAGLSLLPTTCHWCCERRIASPLLHYCSLPQHLQQTCCRMSTKPVCKQQNLHHTSKQFSTSGRAL